MKIKLHYLLFIMTIIFIHIQQSYAVPPPASLLVIKWNNYNITYNDSRAVLDHGRTSVSEWEPITGNDKYIDCVIGNSRTMCLKKNTPLKDDDAYGANLQFKDPVAIFISNDSNSYQHNFDLTPDNEHKNSLIVKKLKKYKPTTPSNKEILKSVYKHPTLGLATESHVYAPVSKAIGGVEYLKLWRSLINITPTNAHKCVTVCSVVLNAELNGKEAIAYCAIFNSNIGLGIPFQCTPVAYNKNGEWWILSYDSPELCGGCGASGGVFCHITTNKSQSELVSILIDGIKKSKMNISLKITDRIKRIGDVELSGKNIAVNSQFFDGYYDLSYARYNISPLDNDTPQTFMIDGYFNLVISSEQSPDTKDYRDISNIGKNGEESDELWFQGKILEIIKSIIQPISVKDVDCEASSDSF